MGHDTDAVKCIDCGQVYAARAYDGEIILPTETGVCDCGASHVVNLTTEERREVSAAVTKQDGSESEPAR
ncbi:hypothetical protein [Halorussus halophilus]|uniref:hypothetical protein n=1 Tax=Halorussus halophilus TaxID=2650975 RepID=UPI0013011FF7|nr:hypothetical protein [Halorussus halophilus]